MKPRLLVPLAAVALAAMAPSSVGAAPTGPDPLGCDATIHDPDSVLDADELQPTIDRAARTLDGDVRIRVESTVDGDLEARLDQLVRQCPGWDAGDGELADDMVVVMFSTTEREASVFYGADQGPELESRWEPAVDAMIEEFRGDDYNAGVEAGLRRLTSSTSVGTSSEDRDNDTGFPTGWLVVGGLVLAALAIYGKVKGYTSGGYDDDTYADSGWYGPGGGAVARCSAGRRSAARAGRAPAEAGRALADHVVPAVARRSGELAESVRSPAIQIRSSASPSNRGSMPNASASLAISSSLGRSSGPSAASQISGRRRASLDVMRNSRSSPST